jgi:uncharacterized membrane protein YciS (DUF1049 family)
VKLKSDSKLSWLIRWPFWPCLLPLLALVIVGLYLGLFGFYRGWRVGVARSEPTAVGSYIDILTALLRNLGDLRSVEVYGAITAKHMVVWGYGTGLVGLSLLSAILVSGYAIFRAPRAATGKTRWILTGLLLLFCLGIYPYVSWKLGLFNRFTVIPKQFWGIIRYQLTPQHGLRDIVSFEMFVVATGYAVSTLLAFASAATLWPVRELNRSPAKATDIEDAAKYLSMQMKHLRVILYVGAILLVVITFRHRNTLNWALEYLKPLALFAQHPTYNYASLIYAQVEALTSNIVLAASVLNTLMLGGLYVPSALLLQQRANALSRFAVKSDERGVAATADEQADEIAGKREAWLKNRALVFPFKEQVPKVIAILSPLLAGPVAEVLNFFK